jgi:hypothetical protein
MSVLRYVQCSGKHRGEHGWDICKGVPNKGKLIELGMEDLTGMLKQ